MEGAGDVAGCVDVGVGGAQVLVDPYPLATSSRAASARAVLGVMPTPTQVVHPGQVGAGHGQPSGTGPGCEQQGVEADPGAVGQDHLPVGPVHGGGGDAQAQVDGAWSANHVGGCTNTLTGPSKPSSRSVCAAFTPASPAPAITNVREMLTSHTL